MSFCIAPHYWGGGAFFLCLFLLFSPAISHAQKGGDLLYGSPIPVQSPSSEPRCHDPFVVRAGLHYFMFSTGRGIPIWVSDDKKVWHRQGRVFAGAEPWATAQVPGFTGYYWAPSVSYFRGKWHLYYSVSTFGSNRSAIGLATISVLDPINPGVGWHDEGLVVQSHKSDNYNAIDPDLFTESDGKMWLAFGSFWGGIRLVQIDPATGKPMSTELPLINLAARPTAAPISGAIEAPCLFFHKGWYYLFVSFDFCCRGVKSTYNIRVGRSRIVTGPYADKDNLPMLSGGGTPVLAGAGRWLGPGHCSVFVDGDIHYLVHHAYDANASGQSKLRMEPLTWDTQGWPHVQ